MSTRPPDLEADAHQDLKFGEKLSKYFINLREDALAPKIPAQIYKSNLEEMWTPSAIASAKLSTAFCLVNVGSCKGERVTVWSLRTMTTA